MPDEVQGMAMLPEALTVPSILCGNFQCGNFLGRSLIRIIGSRRGGGG